MSLTLHPTIAAYFVASNEHDQDKLLRVFTPDAVVVDEQIERRGHAAIRVWQEESSRQYQPLLEPLSVEVSSGATVVAGRVSGNFPGSPVELRFAFVLEGDSIKRLEITAS